MKILILCAGFTLWRTLFLNCSEGKELESIIFQPKGAPTFETLASYKGKINRNTVFASLTLCLRIKIFYLHGSDTFFQLHDNITQDAHVIRGEIYLDKVRPVVGNQWQFHVFPKPIETFRWYHICFTYNNSNDVFKSYLNGKEFYSTVHKVGRELFGDHALLGQGDCLHQSFSGEITQLNIWKSVLSEETIYTIANCQEDLSGDYLSWNSGWALFKVESYEINFKELCNYEEKNYFFGFGGVFYDEAHYICEGLGTHLPIPNSHDEVNQFMATAKELWPNSTICKSDFFAGLNDIDSDGTWVTFYDNKPYTKQIAWSEGEPNGLNFENCAQFASKGVYDTDCNIYYGCALCEFKEKVIFSLRGTCELELRNIHFLAHQNEVNDLMFKGYGEYRIQSKEGTWQWVDLMKNILIATMENHVPNFPMGRRNWTIFQEVCKQKSGQRVLLLTRCKEHEYTCDDATCIPLRKRCDFKYDCIDHSDERSCELVSYPVGYKEELPPRGNTLNNILSINMNVLVESVTVDTALMLIRVSYFLQLSWHDNRLNFINLKNSLNLNKITQDHFYKLWIPSIGFTNSIGNGYTEIDKETHLYVIKAVNKSTIDGSKPGETRLFPGRDNPFFILRKYITTFMCNFDLVLYPFDVQRCGMEFQILSATKRFMAFDMNNTVATYIGSDLLTEYKVGTLNVYHEDDEDYSKTRIEIPLKRRSGYAVLNIYIPSLILLTITYVTLFFRPHIFEVRVMASLTTLLVVATLFTQVSTNLPKTAYFKMVDIWLLFCIATIFLIIIFHTLIDVILIEEHKPINTLKGGNYNLGFNEKKKSELGLKKLKGRPKLTIGLLVLFSRVIVFGLFIIFNACYWGSIVF